MSKIIELRNKRNTLWEQTKAFLEEHRDANGLVPSSPLPPPLPCTLIPSPAVRRM